MDLFLLRIGTSKKLYPVIAYIFGIGHYKPKELGEDDFSRKLIHFYKYGNDLEFFLEKLIELFKLRFEGDSIQFDYLTLYPTRERDNVNQHMQNLIKKFSEHIDIPYKQIIGRNRDIKPNHELRTFEERKDNVYGSIDVLEDVKEKNIIIFDNTSTTGISLIDATNLLFNKGAKHVVCICLGLGYKCRDTDYRDLNKTLKYSKIIQYFRSPYILKEKREQHQKEKNGKNDTEITGLEEC